LLVQLMLDLLRSDLAKHRGLLSDLGKLVETQQHRGDYLALVARGLKEDGKLVEAFDYLLRAASELRDKRGADDRSPPISLASLFQSANAEQRAELDRRIQARLHQSLGETDPAALRQFVELFAFHQASDVARKELILRGTAGSGVRPLEADILLAHLERSRDAATARWAVAQRAALLAIHARHAEAAAVYRRLLEEFPDQVCLDGFTGKQLVERLPAGGPIRALMKPPLAAWPTGQVLTETNKPPGAYDPVHRVPLVGEEPWAKQLLLYFSSSTGPAGARTGVLSARDRLGRRLWEVDLNDGAAARRQRDNWLNRAVACRNLLVVYLGTEIVALDMLRPNGKPEILWRQSLVDTLPGLENAGPFQARFEQTPWGDLQRVATDQWTNKPLGRLGPVTSRYVCFQRGEEVVAVHPLTGRTLWTRGGVPHGCHLFGNDDVVAVAYPDRESGLLLGGIDGGRRGKPTLAAARAIIASAGPRAVAWEDEEGKHVLRLFNVAAKRSDELGRFAAGSKACVVGHEAVAVLQPDGQFMAFRLSDGQPEFEKPQTLKIKEKMGQLYVQKWRGRYIVAVSRAEQQREQAAWTWTYAGYNWHDPWRPAISGSVFGVGEGEPWSAPIENLHWLLDLPSDLPVLAFSSGGPELTGYGGKQVLTVTCLDKRTGRMIFQERRGRAAQSFELTADESQHAVTLRYADVAVTLKFTDQPIDVSPPKKAEAAPPKK
jgi:hypothetical protein